MTIIIPTVAICVAIYVVLNHEDAAKQPSNGEKETLEHINRVLDKQT